MARLSVAWTETAIQQRNLIFKYWNTQNGNNIFSKTLRNKINSRINQLKEFPFLGKEVDFQNTRTISLGHYSLFYQIIDQKIIITAFWDTRQNPKELLRSL